MGIKDKQICILQGFNQRSDFQGWFTKKKNIQKGLSKIGGLGQFGDFRGAWQKGGWCF